MTPIKQANPPLELEMDLASLASLAAIELDDLLLGRRKDLDALKLLATKISSSVPDGEPLDDSTVVAVQHALVDTPNVPTTVTELHLTATELSNEMAEIVNANSNDGVEMIKKLRSFCVALSKHSIASQRSPYEQTEHPHHQYF